MKSFKSAILLMLVVFAAVALVPACKKAPVLMTPSAVEETLSVVKDKYLEEIGGVIGDYQLKTDELTKKAETMSGPAKEEAIKKIDMLKTKLAEGKTKIEELKTATDATWDQTKSDMETIVKDLATIYADAMSAVK